jgi:membrane protease YdiL (CAAX protease family)
MLGLVKRHPVASFFALSYLISWATWGLERAFWPGSWLSWGGGYGPAVAAILLAAVTEGKDGLRELLARLFIWRVGVRWYLVALFLIPVVAVAAIAVYAWLGVVSADLPGLDFWLVTYQQHLILAAAAVTLGLVIVAGEEIGWRGYAQPRLQDRYHPLVTSALIGLFWGLWHVGGPIYGPGSGTDWVDIASLTGGTIAASVIYTWLYNNTAGSLLLACLFHSVYDVVGVYLFGIKPSLAATQGLDLLVFVVAAAMVVAVAGPRLGGPSPRPSPKMGRGSGGPSPRPSPKMGRGSGGESSQR